MNRQTVTTLEEFEALRNNNQESHVIKDVDFINIDFYLYNQNRYYTTVSGWYYINCHFVNCKEALLIGINFIDCKFNSCIFSRIIDALSAYVFNKCMFDDYCTINSIRISVNISYCSFYHMSFRDVTINMGSSITSSMFKGCYINVKFHDKYVCVYDISIYYSDIYKSDFSMLSNYGSIKIDKITSVRDTRSVFIRNLCPEGEFIGYKQVEYEDGLDTHSLLATLLIPFDAKRVASINGKCRCDKAKVLLLETFEGLSVNNLVGTSMYTFADKVKYATGEWVYADKFDDNPLVECSNGIHFFMTKEEAKRY